MKAARIKKGGGIFSLESMDSRVSAAHEKVSGYRQKGIPVRITGTVIEESGNRKIWMIIDRKCGFLNYDQKRLLINQIISRRNEIFSKLAPHYEISLGQIKGAYDSILSFYTSPETKGMLEKIQERKESKYLLPSPNDMNLLAECIHIKESENKRVILLTDDSHFTEFSQEIRERFGIEIESL